jgi:hypothetical protein
VRLCSFCEGKGIVGKFIYGEDQPSVTVEKEEIPVVATLVDQLCRVCRGTGWVEEQEGKDDATKRE